ncbi:MAG TPA: Uma2 family endonuclease [Bryobacteraceae bacterium]|nr:Uma2 family endonuclease [Bryobacteraceae bacterium]
MATKAQVTAEQYLHMTFERDAEFVHGEIVERAVPDRLHSKIQLRILMAIGRLIQSYPLFPYPELRMMLGLGVYRIPDVAVFSGEDATESVPSSPPHLVVEILSKDDRHYDLMEKLEEYRVWGVPNIWVVDPYSKRMSVYTTGGLQNVSSLTLPDFPLELTPAALFSDL